MMDKIIRKSMQKAVPKNDTEKSGSDQISIFSISVLVCVALSWTISPKLLNLEYFGTLHPVFLLTCCLSYCSLDMISAKFHGPHCTSNLVLSSIPFSLSLSMTCAANGSAPVAPGEL